MDKIERKLQKVIYAFIMSVIIIIAAFAVTIYYYETKEISKAAMGEGLFAMAFVDENVGSAPLNASFSSLLFNFEGTPTYHWDFGDGNASNEISPIHNYTEEGEYTCNLTITDSDGRKVTTSVKVLVVTNQPPSVTALILPSTSGRELKGPLAYALAFGPEKLRVAYGDKIIYRLLETSKTSKPPSLLETPGWITCEAQVSDPEGDEIVSYEWELKQQPITLFGGRRIWPSYNFTGKNITIPLWYTFRRGWYDVILTVTDAAGNEASEIKKIQISESDLEIQRNILKAAWEGMWGPNFDYQPEPLRNLLLKIWLVLGPIQTTMDKIMEKVLAPLPENLSSTIYGLYYSLIWESTERDYHKPNFNAPSKPSDPSPADNSTNITLDADLSWNCSDPDGHDINYDIYFGTTSPPPLVISGHSSNSFELGPLQSNTTHYWKIVAEDAPRVGKSRTITGPVWSFTTQ